MNSEGFLRSLSVQLVSALACGRRSPDALRRIVGLGAGVRRQEASKFGQACCEQSRADRAGIEPVGLGKRLRHAGFDLGGKAGRTVSAAAMKAATVIAERALIMMVPCHWALWPVLSLVKWLPSDGFRMSSRKRKMVSSAGISFRRRHGDETINIARLQRRRATRKRFIGRLKYKPACGADDGTSPLAGLPGGVDGVYAPCRPLSGVVRPRHQRPSRRGAAAVAAVRPAGRGDRHPSRQDAAVLRRGAACDGSEVFAPIAAAAGCEFDCMTYDDLTVTAARRPGATILIRGLRDGTDLDYEMQIAGMNETMAPDVQTVFLPLPPPFARSPPHWCARSRAWAATFRIRAARRSRAPQDKIRRLAHRALSLHLIRSFHDPHSRRSRRARLRSARVRAAAARRPRQGQRHRHRHHQGPHRRSSCAPISRPSMPSASSSSRAKATTTTCRSIA